MSWWGWVVYGVAFAAFLSSTLIALFDAVEARAELREKSGDPKAALPWTRRNWILAVTVVLGGASFIITLFTLPG